MNAIKNFLKFPQSKKIIVGLDYTLWPFKAEYKHFLYSELLEYNLHHVNCFLKEVNNQNLELYATSRSSCPDLSRVVLKAVYPEIKFNQIEIFSTKRPEKLGHISNIIDNTDDSFTVFDNDLLILEGIKKVYPNSVTYRAPCGFEMFK